MPALQQWAPDPLRALTWSPAHLLQMGKRCVPAAWAPGRALQEAQPEVRKQRGPTHHLRSAWGHGLGRWLSQPEAPVVYGGVGPQISLPHPKEAPCSGAPDEPAYWARGWGGQVGSAVVSRVGVPTHLLAPQLQSTQEQQGRGLPAGREEGSSGAR